MSETIAPTAAPPATSARNYLQELLPRIVLAPSFAAILIFVYGFILFTGYLSFTDSKMLPSFGLVGLENYTKLWALPHWWRALTNLGIFGSLYIIICSVLGLGLAILLDQKIRAEGVLRPIYLYPMALSFIVTGTAWKWFLDPGIGLEHTMHQWGWESFAFNWIKDRNMRARMLLSASARRARSRRGPDCGATPISSTAMASPSRRTSSACWDGRCGWKTTPTVSLSLRRLTGQGRAMDVILKGTDANTAATDWLKANPDAMKPWLDGVTTFDGGDAAAAVKEKLGS